jgi:hypothetical protein
MAKKVNNNENNNINVDEQNIENTYINGNLKRIVTVKVYKYCIKCGKSFDAPSPISFCDDYCKNEYFSEIRKESDACFNEWCGKD